MYVKTNALLFLLVISAPLVTAGELSSYPVVPPIISLFWSGFRPLSNESQASIDNMRAKLPGYKIQLAWDALIAQLLKPRWSALASIYSNITLPTARSDIARLVLVYSYGGF